MECVTYFYSNSSTSCNYYTLYAVCSTFFMYLVQYTLIQYCTFNITYQEYLLALYCNYSVIGNKQSIACYQEAPVTMSEIASPGAPGSSVDVSLIRYFVFSVIDVVGPPFSDEFVAEFIPLASDPLLLAGVN